MRALSLLAVVVLAFLVVRWFTPSGEPVEASGGASEVVEAPSGSDAGVAEGEDGAAGPRFLARPGEQVAAPAAEAPAPVGGASAPGPDPTAWPATLVPESAPDDELVVARALVHGGPAEVRAASAGLEEDRALLLEAFARLMQGDQKAALELSQGIDDRGGLDDRERALFEAALTGASAAPTAGGVGTVALAMEMELLEREAARALESRAWPEAARAYSRLLRTELDAPWRADRGVLARWSEGLEQAQREHRWNPRGEWPSVEVTVESGDSLIEIRRQHLKQHPDALLCTGMIERANRIRGYIQPGQVLRIPTDRVAMYVDLEARWALYLMGDEVAAAWPVGIGRPGEDTPPGDYVVRNKLEDPPWMKEGQEPIPYGDPRNPLGTRWLGWSTPDGAKTSYGFHGTWEPRSIGHAESDGCVRLLNEDVEELFRILPEGAPIRVVG